MNLHEYQSKRIFARYGIPIPNGEVATTPSEARDIAVRLGGPVVIKSQVLVGGRGKAGGIKLAKDPNEAEARADEILGMNIKGLTVKKVLVDQAADIASEIYLGAVLDRARRRVVLMASSEGGVEIEEVARETPEKIITVAVHPFLGLRDHQARILADGIGLPKQHIRQFTAIAQGLYKAYVDCDASLAEINPLVITGDNKLLALDGKMVLDDSALFRHPDLAELRDPDEEDPSEQEARRYGLSYIHLDGEIGCMVNGAGLAMATMDIVKFYGGEPANFLDVGGGAQADKVAAALRIILSDKRVKAVLINIFGGITRCDEVARGVLEAIESLNVTVPFVVRLVGTNEEEGRRILAEANLITATSLADAAQKAVAAAKGESA
ncbi:ADP-forming succinate--CoA ligase subunit beta [Litorilinea aerophila]|uniref:Succinate--CoA ligase [ADP-forming] subunit beta n=1 Tax=Litorilinea aerophila TaxID=1204385 RepID=A0A540VAT2_9CHLR|nr:ADP-forming succinate--CoA ligase subunit beta [Litorilinea aerophila]MCC9078271.1 ADP-forming succinate--CoA ligase subunit beta [Litorilinea aerophila]GIV77493.1 MAG: succinate--CoA ligase [ADP-forming] subunit beta [Litorilinea sp.]